VEVAIAIVFDAAAGKVLICRRKEETVLGGYWEFPGGKCDAGEAPEACAAREVLEETGLVVRVRRGLEVIEHEYEHARVRLHPFLCERAGGELRLTAAAEGRWVTPGELGAYRFPEANGGLVRGLAQNFAGLWR
jgi:mutator protein MutT